MTLLAFGPWKRRNGSKVRHTSSSMNRSAKRSPQTGRVDRASSPRTPQQ